MTGRQSFRPLSRQRVSAGRWGVGLVVILLVVALRGPQPAATAAPLPKEVIATIFTLRADKPSGFMCLGRAYKIPVYSLVTSVQADGEGSHTDSLFGTAIEATVAEPTIGTISPDRTFTGAGQTAVLDLNSGIPPAPSSAVFTFKGKKAGSTVIYFEGLVREAPGVGGSQYVPYNLPVKVVNCDFLITVSSLGRMDGPASVLTYIVGSVMKAELRPTAEAADVLEAKNWSAWFSITAAPSCKFSVGLDQVEATLRGTLNSDRSVLHLTVGYPSVTMKSDVVCPLTSGFGQGANAPNDVEVKVPTTGGTFVMPDPGSGFPLWGFPMHGEAEITVTPIEAK